MPFFATQHLFLFPFDRLWISFKYSLLVYVDLYLWGTTSPPTSPGKGPDWLKLVNTSQIPGHSGSSVMVTWPKLGGGDVFWGVVRGTKWHKYVVSANGKRIPGSKRKVIIHGCSRAERTTDKLSLTDEAVSL